jgi:hypothetical protein
MLDLVLAWADLDGAMSILLSNILGKSLTEGADLIGRMKTSEKFQTIIQIIRDQPSGSDAARLLKKHKKTYEKYSFYRNRIAHSKLVGFRRDTPDFLVFLAFERNGEDDLVVDAIPIQEMIRAARWGRAMSEIALRLADRIETSRKPRHPI